MTIRILHGDCRDVLPTLIDEQFHACVCDPPYHLTLIHKRFAKTGGADRQPGTEAFGRLSRGFMGKTWDGGDIAFRAETWAAVKSTLRPGAYLAAFGGTRGFHRMMVAIEDAGFEIRDTLMWVYGSGFPKSLDAEKALTKAGLPEAAAQWAGWGTALKPAWEPIVLARVPLESTNAHGLVTYGTGMLNIDDCRIPSIGGRPRDGESSQSYRYADAGATNFAFTPGPRGGDPDGRWPANVLHDGSNEVVSAFPDAPGQIASVGPQHGAKESVNTYGDFGPRELFEPRLDVGSAARFFYTAKADSDDRAGSKHPTVKPTSLMRWLVRLVTPPGGTVLDPFAGTGSTGLAADQLGMNAVLIEQDETYVEDIKRKIAADAGMFASISA